MSDSRVWLYRTKPKQFRPNEWGARENHFAFPYVDILGVAGESVCPVKNRLEFIPKLRRPAVACQRAERNRFEEDALGIVTQERDEERLGTSEFGR